MTDNVIEWRRLALQLYLIIIYFQKIDHEQICV